ncbi:UNVERIFIED_CONTAM: hypothetical protein GTU68_065136 [Idotea baltica]|nr:hypothetical protein [Idotea baltica]
MIGAPNNRHVVVRSIDRADLETAKKIGATGSATVHEAIGRRGYLGADILARQPGARIGGTAVTVLSHPGDNMMIHAAVEVCQPGDVLVVANTAPSTHGMFGDLLATSLMVRGVQGLVMDAGIRDLADLNEMGFPVWSRYVSCQGTVKATPGSVNVPVSIGGIVINPGDVISADDDGVVAVPRAEADWALEKSEARIANEAATRAKLEAGELGVDFYGLRDKILDLGVEYIDRI